MDCVVYPTDGKVISAKRRGHKATERTGRWDGGNLILETTSEGNGPWQWSTTREVLSLSKDGSLMTMSFHFNAPQHDYTVDLERVNQ